jgi:hypothetical protein
MTDNWAVCVNDSVWRNLHVNDLALIGKFQDSGDLTIRYPARKIMFDAPIKVYRVLVQALENEELKAAFQGIIEQSIEEVR